MEWTTEKPTKPGNYWFNSCPENNPDEGWDEIVRISKDERGILIVEFHGLRYAGNSADLYADMGGRWAGPIPEPTEPSLTLGEQYQQTFGNVRYVGPA